MMDPTEFKRRLSELTGMQENRFHPFVWIVGEPIIGEGVYIGGFSEVNARDARVVIGEGCDIASFVAINCADSHRRRIGSVGRGGPARHYDRRSCVHRLSFGHQRGRQHRTSPR